jgi:hypothetical protein
MDPSPTWQSVVELVVHPVGAIRAAAIAELHRLAIYLDDQLAAGSDHYLIEVGRVGEE